MSLTHAHELVHVHNVRDFSHRMPSRKINACFLLNKHGDLSHNSVVKKILFK